MKPSRVARIRGVTKIAAPTAVPMDSPIRFRGLDVWYMGLKLYVPETILALRRRRVEDWLRIQVTNWITHRLRKEQGR